MVTTFLDPDIFTITGVLSVAECQSLIDRAEAIGFEAASVRTTAGPRMLTKVRNNDRVVLNDVALSDLMWSRVKDFLPVLDGESAVGVDSQLRFYRYFPGQQFKRHKDGAVTNSLGQTSKFSYLIYLNDDCEGGMTTFREYRKINGEHTEIKFEVSPSTGTALLFRHERWHEGTPVNSGAKYVLRSDVFYAEPGKQLPSAIAAKLNTDGRGRPSQCASKWIESARCKSSSKLGLNFVSERNCVVVRRGGEQRKENDQSET